MAFLCLLNCLLGFQPIYVYQYIILCPMHKCWLYLWSKTVSWATRIYKYTVIIVERKLAVHQFVVWQKKRGEKFNDSMRHGCSTRDDLLFLQCYQPSRYEHRTSIAIQFLSASLSIYSSDISCPQLNTIQFNYVQKFFPTNSISDVEFLILSLYSPYR